MNKIAFVFLLFYLVYNLLAGFCLAIYYLIKERGIPGAKEFLLLLAFPAIGLGNWIYNRELRQNTGTPYPKKWFIYKNSIKINWGFIGIYLLLGLFVTGAILMIGDTPAYTTPINDLSDLYYNLFIGSISIIFSVVLITLGYILAFLYLVSVAGLYVILILIPKSSMRSIERKLLSENRFNSTS